MKIGLLSDTHGFLDQRIYDYFSEVDEVWHAGDIGDLDIVDTLQAFKPTRIVYGNIDDAEIRVATDFMLRFKCEEVEVLMTHIGGKPGRYSRELYDELEKNGAPTLFVCGHSHILLVKMDQRHKMLWMNPGACGNKGFHKVKTLLRFEINGKKIEHLEAIELGPRGNGEPAKLSSNGKANF